MPKALFARLAAKSISSGPLGKKFGGTGSPVRGLVAPKGSPAFVAWLNPACRNPMIDCPDIFKAVAPRLLSARNLAARHLRPVLQSLLDYVASVFQFFVGQLQTGRTHA